MKKRIVSVLLVCAMGITMLAGCGGSGSGSDSSSAEAGEDFEFTEKLDPETEATINMLMPSSPQTRALQELLETEFKEQYPNIKINITESTGNDIPTQAMTEAVSSAGSYDVICQSATVPALANAGGIYPIDGFIERDADELDFEDFVDNGLAYQGKTYALPYRSDIMMLHYNKEKFLAAGLDPENPPSTWEEFREAAKAMTDESTGDYGLSIDYAATNGNTNSFYLSILYSMGGSYLDEETNAPAFNDEIGVEAAQMYIDWLKEDKVVNPASVAWNGNDEAAAYFSNSAGMLIHWPARYTEANNDPSKSSITGNSLVAPLPGDGGTLAFGWSFVIMDTSEYKNAAWEVIKFATSKDIQIKTIEAGGDCNPTRKSVTSDADLQEKYPVLKVLDEALANARLYPQVTQAENIRAIIGKYINQAATTDMTAQEAMDAAAKEAETALKDSGELKE